MLETFHQCSSVLVEPSPVNFRKVTENRPNSSAHRLAVGDAYGIVEFVGHSAVAGVTENLTDSYLERWRLKDNPRYKVMSAPMSAITDIESLTYIDFISIDVQGGEKSVLDSMDTSVEIGTICIELEAQNSYKDDYCRGLLKDRGFEYRDRLHISEFWHNPNYSRSDLLFDKETKFKFDDFELVHFKPEWVERLRSKFLRRGCPLTTPEGIL